MNVLQRARAVLGARRATVKSLTAMMGSQLLSAALGAAGGIIQATYVSPEVLGYFASFAILFGYLTFFHLGSLTALQRDYSYYVGKGDLKEAHAVAATAQGWILLVCLATASLYGGLVLYAAFSGSFRAAAGWGSQLLLATTAFYTLYLGCTYRSTNEFTVWSKFSAIGALLSFAMLPAVVLAGFWGLCVRAALPALIIGVALHRNRPVRVQPKLSLSRLWGMVKFGLPMDLAGYLATSCMTATMSSLVLKYHGERALGLVAFARVGEGVSTQLAVAATAIFIPRILQKMGATERIDQVARYSLKPALACTLLVAAAIVALVVLGRPLIRLLAARYSDAVPLFAVLAWSGLYPALSLPNHVLTAAKRNYHVAVAHITCFVVFLALAGLSLWMGRSVIWLAMSYVAAKFASAGASWIAMRVVLSRDAQSRGLAPAPEAGFGVAAASAEGGRSEDADAGRPN